MSVRASSLGAGNSIFRSMRPGRRRAESRMSIRLVAMMIYGIRGKKRFIIFFCRQKENLWFKKGSQKVKFHIFYYFEIWASPVRDLICFMKSMLRRKISGLAFLRSISIFFKKNNHLP